MSRPRPHDSGSAIRFGPGSMQFPAVPAVAGGLGAVLALLGWFSVPGSVLDWLLAIVGTLLVIAAVAFAGVLYRADRGQEVSARGVAVRGEVLGWGEVERLSLHSGQRGRQLVAAWPTEPGRLRLRDFGARRWRDGPIWLGDINRASRPAPDVRLALEEWHGKPLET
jgi:hypothetical protein